MNNLWIAQFRAGHYEEALQTSKKAFKLAPENFAAVANLVSALAQLGHCREASKYYDKVTALDATFFISNKGGCYVLEMCEQIDQAAECYREAVKIEPSIPDVWRRLVYILEQKGDFRDAFDTVEKALMFHATELDMWYAQGKLAAKLNKREEALRSYKMVTEINPEDEEVKINIAVEYALSGDLETAFNFLKEANIVPIDVIKTIETEDEYQSLLSDSLYSEKLQTFIDTLRIE